MKRGLERSRAHSALRRYELDRAAQQPVRAAVGRAAGALPDPADGARLADDAAARRADRQPRRRVGRRARGARSTATRARCIAVTHDRWFMRLLDRFLCFDEDGTVQELLARPTTWRCGERRGRDGRRRGADRRPADPRAARPRRSARASSWVLLGPNGGGKTTALSLMGARRQPSAGTVEVLGERLGATDVRALRPRIGHVSHRVADALRGRGHGPRHGPAPAGTRRSSRGGRRSTTTTWRAPHALLASIGCDDARRPAARDVLARRAPAGADRPGAVRRARAAPVRRAGRGARPAGARAAARPR